MPRTDHSDASALRDELLVVRCQLGERAAFDEMIRIWSGPLLAHARRLAGPDMAEDVAQEVWLRALRGLARLRNGAKLRPWLFGVAHHVVMDKMRVRYAEPIAADYPAEDIAAEIPESSEAILSLMEVRLSELPLLERETLSLFYLEALSLAQIAEVQGVPPGTVKSRLFRARGLLRQSMLSQGDLV